MYMYFKRVFSANENIDERGGAISLLKESRGVSKCESFESSGTKSDKDKRPTSTVSLHKYRRTLAQIPSHWLRSVSDRYLLAP